MRQFNLKNILDWTGNQCNSVRIPPAEWYEKSLITTLATEFGAECNLVWYRQSNE